jgi:hypothetical protein
MIESQLRSTIGSPLVRGAFGLCCILIIVFLVYHLGVSGPFVLDDWSQLRDVLTYQREGHQLSAVIFSPSGPLGRPISMLSFVANAVVTGDEIAPLKLTNIFLHVITGLILFFVLYKLTRFVGNLKSSAATALALIVTSIWLLHPLHVSTVLYTVQRMTILAALFSLLGIGCYIEYRLRKLDNASANFWLVFALISWGLAAFSKETGLLLPLFFLLIEFCLPSSSRRIPPMIAATIICAFLTIALLLTISLGERLITAYETRNFSMWQRLLTESRVIFHYIGMIIFPVKESTGFLHDGLRISESLTKPPTTVLSLIAVGLLVWFTIWLRRPAPLVALGLGWFLIGHSMESTVLPLELEFEHRNYLPSVGLLLALTVAINRLLTGDALKTIASIVVLSAAITATSARATAWSSEDKLTKHIMEIRPESQRIGVIFARRLVELGRYEEAKIIMSRYHSYAADVERASIACAADAKLPEQNLQQLIDDIPDGIDIAVVTPAISLANAGLDEECEFSPSLFLWFLTALTERPIGGKYSKDKLLMYKAHFEWLVKDTDRAIRTLEEVHDLNNSPVPLFLAALWLFESDRPSEARHVFYEAKSLAEKSSRNYSDYIVEIGDAIGMRDTR